MIRIRPFETPDFDHLLSLANQAVPFDPRGNQRWFSYRYSFDESTAFRKHFLALDGETPVGYGCLEQQNQEPDLLRIFVVCQPAHLPTAGSFLFQQLEMIAKQAGARRLWARENQADKPLRRFFTERGFQEIEQFTLQDELPMVILQLDLTHAPAR